MAARLLPGPRGFPRPAPRGPLSQAQPPPTAFSTPGSASPGVSVFCVLSFQAAELVVPSAIGGLEDVEFPQHGQQHHRLRLGSGQLPEFCELFASGSAVFFVCSSWL